MCVFLYIYSWKRHVYLMYYPYNGSWHCTRLEGTALESDVKLWHLQRHCIKVVCYALRIERQTFFLCIFSKVTQNVMHWGSECSQHRFCTSLLLFRIIRDRYLKWSDLKFCAIIHLFMICLKLLLETLFDSLKQI